MLMFHVDHFWYIPDESKSAPTAREQFGESLLVWIQSEKQDEIDRVYSDFLPQEDIWVRWEE